MGIKGVWNYFGTIPELLTKAEQGVNHAKSKMSRRVFLLVHDADNDVEADWRVLSVKFEPPGAFLVTLEGETDVHDGEFADGVEQSTK